MTKATDREWSARLEAIGVRPDRQGRLPERLTEDIADRARTRPLGSAYRLRDGDVPGLALHVGAEGATSWWLAYRAQDGKREMLRVGSGDLFNVASARKAASEILVRVRRGENPAAAKREEREAARAAASPKLTLQRFIEGDLWDKKLRFQKSGAGTKARLLDVWKPLLERELPEITREDIEGLLAARRAKGLSAGGVRRDWSALRGALGFAVDERKLERLPTVGLPRPLRGWRATHREEYLDRVEGQRETFVSALRAAEADLDAKDHRLLVFFVRLAVTTGMRRGEILGLRQSEIGTTTITLPAHRTKTNEPRTVNLNAEARAALGIWKLRDAKTGELFPGFADERGFPAPAHSRWCMRLWRAWQELTGEAKMPDFNGHDLRHTFATSLRLAGTPIEVVQHAVGHKNLASTQRYAHVGAREVVEAVAKVTL